MKRRTREGGAGEEGGLGKKHQELGDYWQCVQSTETPTKKLPRSWEWVEKL